MTEQTLYLDTDVVYRDLQDSLTDLELARGSPKDVRRAFSRYVELSQRLTSAMRKDFSRVLNKKWEASTFTGWSPQTELLKYLRNQDQHGPQVFITVRETQYYSLTKDVIMTGFNDGDELIVQGTWQITDHMLTKPPEGLALYLSDSPAKKDPKDLLAPKKVEYQYVLLPRDEKDKQRFDKGNALDIHILGSDSFKVLTKYYKFFNTRIFTGA